jgi:hypothetical protein
MVYSLGQSIGSLIERLKIAGTWVHSPDSVSDNFNTPAESVQLTCCGWPPFAMKIPSHLGKPPKQAWPVPGPHMGRISSECTVIEPLEVLPTIARYYQVTLTSRSKLQLSAICTQAKFVAKGCKMIAQSRPYEAERIEEP